MSDQRPVIRSDALEPFEDFVRRHVGPSEEEQSGMLKVLGYETLDALIDAAVPGSVRSLDALDLPPATSEREVLDELRRLAAQNRIVEPLIGLGYSRDDHAGCDPAQRAREPGVVHRLHPVPTGDQPGTPRSAAEFPDDGVGPQRTRHRQRLPARRGHGGRGGRHPHAPARRRRVRPCPRGCRLPATDHRSARNAPRAARHAAHRRRLRCGFARRRLLRHGPAVPGVFGCHPRLRGAHRRGARERCEGGRVHGPLGADPSETPGGVGG